MDHHPIIWLHAALDDVDAIAAYIAMDSTVYASVVVQKIMEAAEALADAPMLGRCVPEWWDEKIRERILYSYRLIYRVEGERIVILAVIHGARMLPDGLRDRSH